MEIGGSKYESITIVGADNEVLAVISDKEKNTTEIIEKNGVRVLLNEKG